VSWAEPGDGRHYRDGSSSAAAGGVNHPSSMVVRAVSTVGGVVALGVAVSMILRKPLAGGLGALAAASPRATGPTTGPLAPTLPA